MPSTQRDEKIEAEPLASREKSPTKPGIMAPASKRDISGTIVVIEKRALIRECLARCISVDFGCPVVTFPDIESWQEASSQIHASLIIVSTVGAPDASRKRQETTRLVGLLESHAPVVVLSDAEDIDQIADSLKWGARGHLPTGTAFDVAIEAMRLVIVGGTFVPAHSLLGEQRPASKAGLESEQKSKLTARQVAVADALRQGKANKLIAYELNMSESTVKVHMRNIMKKLSAKNRTEVAVKLVELPDGK
jgi:DNA-binding NarL/FixJ family response regulator